MSILQALKEDFRFYRSLRFGARRTVASSWFLLFTSAGLLLLAMHRAAHDFQRLRGSDQRWGRRTLLRVLLRLTDPLMVFRSKSDISGATQVSPGVYFSDQGQLVIGARSIGAGTVIHHAVTIGMSTMNQGTPRVGANVWIGPDCVVYGNIEIGEGATLLPGTVLSKSIPPRCVVKGNPGRIVEMNFDNTKLRSSLKHTVDLADLKAL